MEWPVSEGQLPPRPTTRFSVGDKVRVVCIHSSYHGAVTRVIGELELCKRRSFFGDRPWCYMWTHDVDIRPRSAEYASVAFTPSELVPHYDGMEPSTWSLCEWQPTKEHA